jgi:hypothetical protein
LNLIRFTPAKGQDMQRSIFLARLIGPFFAVCGVALMLNPDVFRAIGAEIIKSHAMIYLLGLLALVAGLALVNTHNVWVAGWPVVITIAGWFSLVIGIIRVVFPRVPETLGTAMLAAVSNNFIFGEGLVFLALGAWLSYAGYAPRSAPIKKKR